MGDLSDQLKNIAYELTHIEVNTIIKPNMTGRRMPKPRHALIEIARRYANRLGRMGFDIDMGSVRPGCFASFDLIREKADEAIKAIEAQARTRKLTEAAEADLILVYRIKTMSDQLKGILNAVRRRGVDTWDNDYSHNEVEEKNAPFPLDPDERVAIRKIWEMGLEQVAMQSVIQIDGDVVTRLQPKYAAETDSAVYRIHNESVRMALDVWGQMIGIVKDFFGGLLRKP